MKPRIAVFLQPQHAEYDQIRAAAIESEKIGADVIYNWDHFYPYIKKMEPSGLKEKGVKVNILNVGQCFQVGQR